MMGKFKSLHLSSWMYKISLGFISTLLFVAIFSDFLANGVPILCRQNSVLSSPATEKWISGLTQKNLAPDLRNDALWRGQDYDFVIWPPVRFSPDSFDPEHYNFAHPGSRNGDFIHYLGTDDLGRDVLSGIIYGTRTAVLVGFASVGLALLMGLILGVIAGYYGDNSIKVRFLGVVLFIPTLILAYFYAFNVRSETLADSFSIGFFEFFIQLLISLVIFFAIFWIIFRFKFLMERLIPMRNFYTFFIPFDLLISRLIEIFVSIPKILLIVSIAAFAKPSITLIIVIIAFTSWMGIARFVRAEMMKIKSLEYIEASKALGFSSVSILLKQAIPNALRPVIVSASFGVASAIMAEATISFLNIGIPPESVTWGKMLSLSRSAPTAWWIALTPGIMIFLTVASLNIIGQYLNQKKGVLNQ